MDVHAFELLDDAKSWDWPITKRIQKDGGRYNALIPKLLLYLIKESELLGGTVLDQFWDQVSKCHPKLEVNGA
jgi:hypothetical protein